MPGSNTIALLENADLSTTIHELGHYFLHTGLNIANALEAKAARGEELSLGERQHLADMQATLNWLGLADLQAWNALTFEQQRPYHEQLARGFEAYIMEGRAPSLEMRSVFQRMKAWMLRVYQNLTRLDVQLSDEVRGVFDRLLASDEEIALAEQNRSMALLFDDPEAAGMSAEEFADYQALGQAATTLTRLPPTRFKPRGASFAAAMCRHRLMPIWWWTGRCANWPTKKTRIWIMPSRPRLRALPKPAWSTTARWCWTCRA